MPPPVPKYIVSQFGQNGKSQEVRKVEGKKKMGRPTDAPKVNNYRLRMTDEELQKLEVCCERTGLSRADVIRLGIDKIYRETQK